MPEDKLNKCVTDPNAGATMLAGRYRVVRQLGQGGMGSVWLAEDTQLDNRQVAIKMLPSILVSNKRAYQQLKSEALVSLKLTHPNIATLRAFEENGGNPFLVVDFIDGQTLDDYLAEKGKLSEEETIRLLAPVAAALDYAHSKGVVHRDVKPANVMIAKDGTPYVLDFGIAREIQETMTRVTGKLSSGTLMYMSPEQLNGDAPTPAQDVYSFAVMVYECLKGELPFCRGAIEDQIKNKVPAPLDPHIAISGSVMAGLAKDAANRPTSCAAVLVGSALPSESLSASENAIDALANSKASQEEVRKLEHEIVTLKTCIAKRTLELDSANALARARNEADRLRHQLEEMSHPLPGAMRTIVLPGGVTMDMIYCPHGEFMMGSRPDEDGYRDWMCLHKVTLTKGFWIGKYPVTQAQWKSVMGSNPSHFVGDDLPVESVSWKDCRVFCIKAGHGFALPTEAQWEYACRAGSDKMFGGTGNLSEMGWSCNNLEGKTHPVGTKLPNAWGIYDMHGNVAEWCADHVQWDGERDAEFKCCATAVTDPVDLESTGLRAVRGGSWSSCSEEECRSGARDWMYPIDASESTGFRVCAAEEALDDEISTENDGEVEVDDLDDIYVVDSTPIHIPGARERLGILGICFVLLCTLGAIGGCVHAIEEESFSYLFAGIFMAVIGVWTLWRGV